MKFESLKIELVDSFLKTVCISNDIHPPTALTSSPLCLTAGGTAHWTRSSWLTWASIGQGSAWDSRRNAPVNFCKQKKNTNKATKKKNNFAKIPFVLVCLSFQGFCPLPPPSSSPTCPPPPFCSHLLLFISSSLPLVMKEEWKAEKMRLHTPHTHTLYLCEEHRMIGPPFVSVLSFLSLPSPSLLSLSLSPPFPWNVRRCAVAVLNWYYGLFITSPALSLSPSSFTTTTTFPSSRFGCSQCCGSYEVKTVCEWFYRLPPHPPSPIFPSLCFPFSVSPVQRFFTKWSLSDSAFSIRNLFLNFAPPSLPLFPSLLTRMAIPPSNWERTAFEK